MESVTRKRYTAEFKAQAVELVGLGKPVSEVAEDLEIGTNVLYRWVRQVAARKCQPQTGERHFKKGCRHPRHQTPVVCRAMIQAVAQKTGGSIRKVCVVLGEARGRFYGETMPVTRAGKRA